MMSTSQLRSCMSAQPMMPLQVLYLTPNGTPCTTSCLCLLVVVRPFRTASGTHTPTLPTPRFSSLWSGHSPARRSLHAPQLHRHSVSGPIPVAHTITGAGHCLAPCQGSFVTHHLLPGHRHGDRAWWPRVHSIACNNGLVHVETDGWPSQGPASHP